MRPILDPVLAPVDMALIGRIFIGLETIAAPLGDADRLFVQDLQKPSVHALHAAVALRKRIRSIESTCPTL
jgi:hypothetical protein